jgi:hypothetical protein
MEGFLYYCRDANKDVENSYENTICITSYSIPKDIGILKCNLHLLWATIFLALSPRVPMCQTWAIVQAITNTSLLVVKQCVLN